MDNRFIVDESGVGLIDSTDKLMWLKDLSNISPMSWEDAMEYVKNLDAGGYDKWRLSNRRELVNMTIDTCHLGKPYIRQRGCYWTSEIHHDNPGHRWVIDLDGFFDFDSVRSRDIINIFLFWPVRDLTPSEIEKYCKKEEICTTDINMSNNVCGFDITKLRPYEELYGASSSSPPFIDKLKLLSTELETYTQPNEVIDSSLKDALKDLQRIIYLISTRDLRQKINAIKSKQIDMPIKLSKRELSILYYLSLHKSPKEIANLITLFENKSIDKSTVAAYINKGLYPKFEVFNVEDLIDKAYQKNLIPFGLE